VGDVHEWATIYAGDLLAQASSRGYRVDKGVISRWKDHQRRAALAWSMPQGRERNYYYTYQPDVVQAYRLYTLALAGAPETGAMNRLREMPGVSVTAKWRLAAAYALAGRKSAAEDVIADIKTTRERWDYTFGSGYTYGSPQRDAAMVLETLVLLGDITGAMRQARELAGMLAGEEYLSTQSTAFALAAMGALASKAPTGEISYSYDAGAGAVQINSSKAVSNVVLPVQGAGEVGVTSRSGGELFLALTTRTRPTVDTAPAMASGISVSVAYTDLAGNVVNPATLDRGTDLRAVVTVANISGTNSYTDLALTHIVPSGWEIFNERMAIGDAAMEASTWQSQPVVVRGGRTARQFTYQDIRDDRVLTYFDLPRGVTKSFAVRLQAAYAGRFVLPAVQCEAMYYPAVRSRTAAGRVEVK
jgi:uncharacterized protein YfaS (alpha-2-macroglobulin family)